MVDFTIDSLLVVDRLGEDTRCTINSHQGKPEDTRCHVQLHRDCHSKAWMLVISQGWICPNFTL